MLPVFVTIDTQGKEIVINTSDSKVFEQVVNFISPLFTSKQESVNNNSVIPKSDSNFENLFNRLKLSHQFLIQYLGKEGKISERVIYWNSRSLIQTDRIICVCDTATRNAKIDGITEVQYRTFIYSQILHILPISW